MAPPTRPSCRLSISCGREWASVRITTSPSPSARVHDEEQALPPVLVMGDDVRQRFGDLVDEELVHRGESGHEVSSLWGQKMRLSLDGTDRPAATQHRYVGDRGDGARRHRAPRTGEQHGDAGPCGSVDDLQCDRPSVGGGRGVDAFRAVLGDETG